jgi:hypothetical protein
MARRSVRMREEEVWTGSTKGPHVIPWPKTWYRHPKDSDCRYGVIRGESVVVKLGGEMVNCFLHFWCGPGYRSCSACKRTHPTISFDGKNAVGQSLGLFRSEDPCDNSKPIGVYCRACAHQLWKSSERFLDSLDPP